MPIAAGSFPIVTETGAMPVGHLDGAGHAIVWLPASPNLTASPPSSEPLRCGDRRGWSFWVRPCQSTNLRVRDRSVRVLSARGSIEVLVAANVKVVIEGEALPVDLTSKHARCLLENATQVEPPYGAWPPRGPTGAAGDVG